MRTVQNCVFKRDGSLRAAARRVEGRELGWRRLAHGAGGEVSKPFFGVAAENAADAPFDGLVLLFLLRGVAFSACKKAPEKAGAVWSTCAKSQGAM